ncbi:hypothetical protein HBI56_017880 [Parastagonospora nodorum]|nr:hypothetical protein HBH74_072020 [Parastagonospora nodorum]KAH4975399.1 hypothetical protein HBH73_038990 [Parastagonospora nodorum]KAH4992325.1 hypothetical protein HBI76_048970 [Parastagonospora nodorum]KAH5109869.1 hypothetical protein HBH72_025520 [Parastagonospora nodorum]KAH5132755.1 hypothetical protein HBI73_086900 [Parastagonospora nodorum]
MVQISTLMSGSALLLVIQALALPVQPENAVLDQEKRAIQFSFKRGEEEKRDPAIQFSFKRGEEEKRDPAIQFSFKKRDEDVNTNLSPEDYEKSEGHTTTAPEGWKEKRAIQFSF